MNLSVVEGSHLEAPMTEIEVEHNSGAESKSVDGGGGVWTFFRVGSGRSTSGSVRQRLGNLSVTAVCHGCGRRSNISSEHSLSSDQFL